MRLKNPFKRKKIEEPVVRYGAGSHAHLREKPKKDLKTMARNIKIQADGIKPKQKQSSRIKFRYASLLLLPIGALMLGIVYLMFFSSYFSVKKIEFTQEVSESSVRRIEESLLGNNLLLLSINQIESIVSDNIEFSDQVYVRKIFPEKIEIIVDEKVPKYVYVDLDRYGLFDEDLDFIEYGSVPYSIDLTEEESEYLSGKLNIDSPYVKEVYFNNLTEDEIADFDWEIVPQDQKEQILENVRVSAYSKIDSYFQNNTEILQQQFGDLRIIKTTEENSFTSREVITRITQSDEVISTIDLIFLEDFTIDSINWKNAFTLEIKIGEKTFIFGELFNDEEEIKSQLEIMQGIYDKNKFSEFNKYDFRTEDFSVSN